MSKLKLIDPLEPRRHLSAAVTEKGLPREITQVGDTLYYALDTKRDGHLTYGDLVGYSPKIGKRVSIKRDDGKAFGQLEYTLEEGAGRLIIHEQVKDKSTGYTNGYVSWIVEPGETRARKLSGDNFDISPYQFARVGDRIFYTGYFDDGHGQRLMSIGAHEKVGTTAFEVGQLYGQGSISQTVAYEGKLVLDVSKYNDAHRLYISDGTLAGTSRVALPTKAAFGVQDLGVVGTKLVFNIAEQRDKVSFGPENYGVYQMDDVTSAPREYVPLKGQKEARVTAYGGGKAFLSATMDDGTTRGVFSGLTAKTTTHLGMTVGTEYSKDVFLVGNSAYFCSSWSGSPFDPETVGGYVAPGSTSGSISVNVAGDAVEFQRIDLVDGSVTTLRRGYTVNAGHYAAVGGTIYFRTTPSTLENHNTTVELWKTDGTAAGTVKVTDVFDGPFSIDSKLYTTATYDAKQIDVRGMDRGAIAGRVVRDDDHTKSLAGLDGMAGRTVWLDIDHDNRLDAAEPSMKTDDEGTYHFGNLKAGRYDVLLADVGNWTPTRAADRTVSVSDGALRAVDFGLSDMVRNASITGRVSIPISIYPPELVKNYADVTLKVMTPGGWKTIRTLRTAEDGKFIFDHLVDGEYTVEAVPGRTNPWEGTVTLPMQSTTFLLAISAAKKAKFS